MLKYFPNCLCWRWFTLVSVEDCPAYWLLFVRAAVWCLVWCCMVCPPLSGQGLSLSLHWLHCSLLNNISQKVRPANCQPRAGHNALDNTLGTWDPGSAPSHRIIILFKLFRTFLDKIISPGRYNSGREVKKNYDLGTPRWPDPSGLTKINSIVTVIWICLLTRPRWGYLSFNKVTSAHIPSRIFDVKMTDRPGLPASPRLVCRPPRSADFTDGVRRCRKISSRHLLAPQIHPEFFN